MPENPYGFAVMYTDGEDMGEYLGYFQDSMDTAESVADEIMSNSDQLSPIGIYRLVLVKTIEPPVEETDDDIAADLDNEDYHREVDDDGE